ncbi:MAG: phosphatase PAP2 family protein [Anaerolineales bacterium]|nr:phosphatase PAP2 family protein [Anaerolineales bacterium]
MDSLIQNGIDWIIAIQSLGSWLELPMKFFTFLGNENFFFLVLPLVYWSVDAGLGLRVAFVLATSDGLKCILKLLFAGPRPYWISSQVQALSVESSFGVPSGHAQNSAALWGLMASGLPAHRRWAWITAFTLAILIGFSRLFLGVHFVHDVIAGWLIGYAILFAFLRFWDPVAAWLKMKTIGQQAMIAFLVSLFMIALGILSSIHLDNYVFPAAWTENALRSGPLPEPASIQVVFTSAGSLFGLAVGAAWIASRGGYQTEGPVAKRALRYVIGLIGVMILWEGLGAVLPRGETWVPLILRYIRYTLVGFWITAGAPWLFFHFKLARKPNM